MNFLKEKVGAIGSPLRSGAIWILEGDVDVPRINSDNNEYNSQQLSERSKETWFLSANRKVR
jgi:hypothetical protein